jgi:hypothetical protein
MGSPLVSPPVAKAAAMFCPNCGGPVEIRGFAHTLSVVCPQCLSVLDATSPLLHILQTVQIKERIQPKIPLGTRGKWNGVTYEAIGFQVRDAGSDEDFYSWEEYLLFNPYYGFRYLTEFNGHWNFVRVMHALPGGKRDVIAEGRTYRLFDSGIATTSYVLGEFPWQVRVGETVKFNDYIAPPYMLSSEETDNEVTWSLGQYTTGQQVWQAFQLPGQPPPAEGIFANQPSPVAGKAGHAWRTWLWLTIALVLIAMFVSRMKLDKEVFQEQYTYTPAARTLGSATPTESAAFITHDFELPGHRSNIELLINTDIQNDWIFFGFSLINDDTGVAYDFGREIAYFPSDDEEKGKPRDSVVIPGIPPGKYYFRIEPEMSPASQHSVRYNITVRRDVPTYGWYWIAGLLLLIPPIVVSLRSRSFEAARWRESDYGAAAATSTGGSE